MGEVGPSLRLQSPPGRFELATSEHTTQRPATQESRGAFPQILPELRQTLTVCDERGLEAWMRFHFDVFFSEIPPSAFLTVGCALPKESPPDHPLSTGTLLRTVLQSGVLRPAQESSRMLQCRVEQRRSARSAQRTGRRRPARRSSDRTARSRRSDTRTPAPED